MSARAYARLSQRVRRQRTYTLTGRRAGKGVAKAPDGDSAAAPAFVAGRRGPEPRSMCENAW